MLKKNKKDLHTPQLQSPVAMILILYKFFTLVLRNAFPILLIFLFNPDKDRDNFELFIILGISLVSTILSIAAYYKFKYHIKDDEVIIKKGILKKVNLNVPFDRIQAINTNQNLIHRLFNVASLEIDTAGSKNSEIKIDAVSVNIANELKEYILSKKALIERTEGTSEEMTDSSPIEKELLRLDIPALLKVGIGQNHLRSLAVIGLFTIGMMQYIDIFLSKKEYNEMTDQVSSLAYQFILALIPLVLIATFLFTLVKTILRFYDLRFKETEKGYQLVSGLFTRNEKQANFHKIQLIGWHTNPLKKLFGMFELNLSQAFSTSMVKSQTMQIPGMYNDQLQKVCESYFPEVERDDLALHTVNPRLMIRVMGQIVGIIGLAASIKYLFPQSISYHWIWILLALVFGVIYTYISWQKWQVKISANGILIRRGFVRTSYTLLKWNKIQGLRTRQSIFQKRHQLTDLHIFTAAGTIKIPYLNEVMVSQLQDYLLYYVETNNEPWI